MFDWLVQVWASSAANKAMIIGGAVILVGAIVGVIYGVLTQQDRGFMKAKNGKPLRWSTDKMPLTIRYTEDAEPLLQHLIAILGDINMFSKRVVFNLTIFEFGREESLEHDPIEVLFDVLPTGATVGGTTDLRWDERTGELLSAHVQIDRLIRGEQLITVIRHEFGHVLGLDHDDKKNSVMHPRASQRDVDFTDNDKERITKAVA